MKECPSRDDCILSWIHIILEIEFSNQTPLLIEFGKVESDYLKNKKTSSLMTCSKLKTFVSSRNLWVVEEV
jgi:hypothetical protein